MYDTCSLDKAFTVHNYTCYFCTKPYTTEWNDMVLAKIFCLETTWFCCKNCQLHCITKYNYLFVLFVHWWHYWHQGNTCKLCSFWNWKKTHILQNFCNLLTLKMSRKPASEDVVCLCHLLNILENFSNLFLHTGKQCEPYQTAPLEQSDLGPHCLQKRLLKSQADNKSR